jgi:type IV pilus assembly protein PilA
VQVASSGRTQPTLTDTVRHVGETRAAALHLSTDSGFTLIELMVVLLILAILLAIAIPTFLGVTKSANDRAAQSNLNTAFTNAKSIFQTNSQTYVPSTGATGSTNQSVNAAWLASSLTSAEPSLSFVYGTVGTGSPSTISVNVSADGTSLALAAQAKGTKSCWYIVDNTTGSQAWNFGTATTAGQPLTAGTWYGEQKNQTNCSAASLPTAASAWQQSGFPNL